MTIPESGKPTRSILMRKLVFSSIIIWIVLPIESYFSEQAYFTNSSLVSGLFYFISYTTIFLSILLLVLDMNRSSMVILALGLFAVVPYNLYCANDLRNLKAKSDNLVHWVYQQKLKTNSFPAALKINSDPRITYSRQEDGFSLFFYVATPTTGHFYTSRDGWGYMDD